MIVANKKVTDAVIKNVADGIVSGKFTQPKTTPCESADVHYKESGRWQNELIQNYSVKVSSIAAGKGESGITSVEFKAIKNKDYHNFSALLKGDQILLLDHAVFHFYYTCGGTVFAFVETTVPCSGAPAMITAYPLTGK